MNLSGQQEFVDKLIPLNFAGNIAKNVFHYFATRCGAIRWQPA